MKQITIQSPLDMHLHLRDETMLSLVAPLSAKTFSGGLIMPNLVPPITTKNDIKEYKKRILNAIGDEKFEPFMTLFFQNYDYKFLEDIKEDILAIKLYPAGITTNSQGGISSFDIENLRPTLETMSELDIPLCVHGETSGFVLDREKEFLPIYENLASSFPKLKIIMEHITTKESAELLEKYENLFATITVQHLLITLDDVAGGLLKPHLFCKPIAKTDADKKALQQLALNACEKVMFGSDSAPHPKSNKESCGCAAGVFTAPIALQVLAELFDNFGKIQNLQDFVCNNALKIYGINPPKKEIVLTKQNFTVPQEYKKDEEIVVPMFAGETIAWSCEVKQ